MFIFQLNIQLINTYTSEDHLSVTDHIFWVTIFRDFKFDTSNIIVTTESPKMRFLDSLNTMELCYLKQNCRCYLFISLVD